MAILVTGGAGYIGSHTCVELINSGYEIVVIDNFSNSKPEIIDIISEITNKKFYFYKGNLEDRSLLKKIFDTHKLEAVIHFAGLKSVGESINNPLGYYGTNVGSTLVLCEVMREFGVKKLVFSSSATVYGDPQKLPITEDSTTTTTNPYGYSKLVTENILQDLFKSDHGWSINILRYFNPIGAHTSGLIGENPVGVPNNLLPYIAKVAIGELECLDVFGGDYDTCDGTGVRDYLHVVDLSLGHVKALENVITSTGVDIINLGTGIGYSVIEVIRAFEKASGRKIKYRIVGRRPGDIAQCYADTSKAKKNLGWVAKKNIDDMCKDAWRYILKSRGRVGAI
ncbi:UDP-glucose 4-epimerase GalE [Paenibacillus thiaminolyticus]|uniref:UDP-glucose 4-epimerase n=1 Tax=Paenibacillus thiaminolyticus TaxID=49283 RepID=A0A3A3GJ50_PANTH|nr:UDP-glucose 4-epimerase GalE [Paenibacillus thiaminolyticus]RJG24772.1 UDP-glucose 4-epimerase GalE [Paenibacillus thiaminolyticus]